MGIPRHVRSVRRPTKRLDNDVAFARCVYTLRCASVLSLDPSHGPYEEMR
jgi:hypothetical protein